MSDLLVRIAQNTLAARAGRVPVKVITRARTLHRNALASMSQEDYRRKWRHFEHWCAARRLVALPAADATVMWYFTALSERSSWESVRAYRKPIVYIHRRLGYADPFQTPRFARFWDGLRRQTPRFKNQKVHLTVTQLRRVVAAIPKSTLRGLRDRAVFLVGFLGSLASREIRALMVEDVVFTKAGMYLTICTGLDAEKIFLGKALEPEYCPVRALRAWLRQARLTNGPVFRGVKRKGLQLSRWGQRGEPMERKVLYIMVKRRIAQVGLDAKCFGTGSLEAGFLIAAADAGMRTISIMKHTRRVDPRRTIEEKRKAHSRHRRSVRNVNRQ